MTGVTNNNSVPSRENEVQCPSCNKYFPEKHLVTVMKNQKWCHPCARVFMIGDLELPGPSISPVGNHFFGASKKAPLFFTEYHDTIKYQQIILVS